MAFYEVFRARHQLAGVLPSRPEQCDFVAIDFETANETRGSACAIGLSFVQDGEVVASGSTLINPETYFNAYCTAVNGISEEHVLNAPTLLDLWPSLTALLDGQTVVAHNASFDMSVLRNTAARYEVGSGPSFDVMCTYRLARATWPDMPSHSLGYVASALGIDFNHHEAGEDSVACALVALRICDQLAVPRIGLAAAALNFLPGRLTAESYQAFRLEAHGPHGRKLTSADGNANADPTHPLYGKTICFTGTLVSMVRSDAMERVTALGCNFKNNVSRKLDYLVIGDGDFVQFANGWTTGKLDRAMQLRDDGATIEIIPEKDFLQLLMS